MRSLPVLLLLGLGACRIISHGEVQLPYPGPTFRVDCHYEFDNCRHFAEKACPEGHFEEITRGNCPKCSLAVPRYPQKNAVIQQPSYRGTLFYRCM